MTSAQRLAWFREAGFGLFVHWSTSSVGGVEIGWGLGRREVEPAVYERWMDEFRPSAYDPDSWARLATEAGMRYAVLTTKHHDGFCMWPTDQTDYHVGNTPGGQDLVGPFVEAFRSAGLKVGFYHSLIDWRHPHYRIDHYHPSRDDAEALAEQRDWNVYVTYLHNQVDELLGRYGKIDVMWFDYSYVAEDGEVMAGPKWKADELLTMVREKQPEIVINNRLALRYSFEGSRNGFTPPDWMQYGGDFDTPERYVPGEFEPERPWESCLTMSETWAWNPRDKEYKSAEVLVAELEQANRYGGNVLLNVGPKPDGLLPEIEVARLREIADLRK